MATNYAGIGSGALGGAASGFAVGGPYGAAAGAVLGGLSSALSGDGGAAAQQQIEANNLQNSQNQQDYAHRLNAIALQRAIAGSTDSQGSSIRYDPTTNSWVSSLGAAPQRVQGSINAADLMHNSVDVPQASQNNAASSIQASLARRGMSGALNSLSNYQPVSQAALYGALQDSSTRANQISQNPIIADTLRQFARSGSAAGPVLAQLQRASSDSLSQEMSNNVIKSMTGAADVNNANRQSLSTPISTLYQAGTPQQQDTRASYTQGPASELAAQINGRAAASASPASSGSAYSAYGTSANTNAASGASAVAGNDPTAGFLASAERSANTLNNNGGASAIANMVKGWFGSPSTGAVPKRTDSSGALITDPNYNPYTQQNYVAQDGMS